MELGEPLRRGTVVPTRHPVRAPEPQRETIPSSPRPMQYAPIPATPEMASPPEFMPFGEWLPEPTSPEPSKTPEQVD